MCPSLEIRIPPLNKKKVNCDSQFCLFFLQRQVFILQLWHFQLWKSWEKISKHLTILTFFIAVSDYPTIVSLSHNSEFVSCNLLFLPILAFWFTITSLYLANHILFSQFIIFFSQYWLFSWNYEILTHNGELYISQFRFFYSQLGVYISKLWLFS